MTDPKFALIDSDQGLVVEVFDPTRHLSQYGWSLPGVVLFCHPREVEHLRDQIIN
jgi:hypothetical protein